MNHWLRLWYEMPNDPKWRTIARLSGRSISEVIAVYIHLLVDASNAVKRGETQCNNEAFQDDLGSALDLSREHVFAIISAMRGRVLDGERLSGWDKRQPQREDNSTDRVKAFREKLAMKRNETQCNALKPKKREEEKREEENIKPATPPAQPRATRLQMTQPTEEMTRYALEEMHWSVDRLSEVWVQFVDYWKAKAGKDAAKLDWAATWRNWCRNQRAPAKTNGSLFPPKKSFEQSVTDVFVERYQRGEKLL